MVSHNDCTPPACILSPEIEEALPLHHQYVDAFKISKVDLLRLLEVVDAPIPRQQQIFDSSFNPQGALEIFKRFGSEFIHLASEDQLRALSKNWPQNELYVVDQVLNGKPPKDMEFNEFQFNPYTWWRKNHKRGSIQSSLSQKAKHLQHIRGPNDELDYFIRNVDYSKISYDVFHHLFLHQRVGRDPKSPQGTWHSITQMVMNSANYVDEIQKEPKRRFALLTEDQVMQAILRFDFGAVYDVVSEEQRKNFIAKLNVEGQADEVFQSVFDESSRCVKTVPCSDNFLIPFFQNRNISLLSKSKFDVLFPSLEGVSGPNANRAFTNGLKLNLLSNDQLLQIKDRLDPKTQEFVEILLADRE